MRTTRNNQEESLESTAIAVQEEEKHPNFIESNTQAITLEELTNNNIIPTFGDNSLTISHQSFIGAVLSEAEKVFGDLKPVECRVSHPIIGRVPSAQHKKINELRDDEKTIFYQRMAFCAHVKNLTKTMDYLKEEGIKVKQENGLLVVELDEYYYSTDFDLDGEYPRCEIMFKLKHEVYGALEISQKTFIADKVNTDADRHSVVKAFSESLVIETHFYRDSHLKTPKSSV